MTAKPPSPTPGTGPVVNDNNPWPGLLAFNEHFRKYFFGRGAELEDLFRRVRQETLTVLYAQSGLGKTSLLQAGLFHRLSEEGFLPVPIRIDYGGTTQEGQSGTDAPQRQIQNALAAAITERAGGEATNPRSAPGIWEYLHDVELVLSDETGSPLTPVLIFDQFEELFTLGAGRRDDGRFADQVVQLLGDLIENRPPHALERAMAKDPSLVDRYDFSRGNYRVLLSLREDYLPHLHGLRRVIPSIILNNLRLTRFNRQQALEVVERPAAARGLVTRQVAEAIVRTVAGLDTAEAQAPKSGVYRAGEPESKERLGERLEVDPALLCLFCRELNQLRQERNEPGISLELVAGSKESVLRDFYLDCFQGLSPPPEPGVKAFVEDYLLTSKGYRDRLTVERASEILVSDYNGRPEELTTLVDRRLLQIEERGKTPQIELTHDVLAPIAMGERLERVRNQALQEEELRRQEALRRAEREEREAKEREAAAAVALATARRQQRRTLALLGVVAVAAGAAVVLAVVARTKAREAQRARTAAVVAESTAVHERDLQIGLADNLRRQQTALAESTKVAQEARRRMEVLVGTTKAAQDSTARMLTVVSAERATSEAVVSDFCDYALDLLKSLGDSTEQNSSFASSYGIVIEKSDLAVTRIIKRREGVSCTRQLSTRLSTADTRNRRLMGSGSRANQDSVRMLAFKALGAARSLATDTASRRVAAESYYDLVYEFHLMSQRDRALQDTTARVASEGVRVAAMTDPSRDSAAFNRRGRIYHYAAIALTRLGRVDSARRVIDAGLAAIAQGKTRTDQTQSELLFTESQLRMRRGEADSASNQVDQALREFEAAVVIARTRLNRFQFTDNRRWLSVAHRAAGDMAVAFGRHAEAFTAFDSSGANYRLYANRQLDTDVHDTAAAVNAMHTLRAVRISQATAALALGRTPAAVSAAREAVEVEGRVVELRPSAANQATLRRAYSDVFTLLERSLSRSAADSVYDAWFRRDSAQAVADIAAASSRSRGSTRAFGHSIDEIIATIAQRVRADTTGKPADERARRITAYGLATLRLREPRVWLQREIVRRTQTDGARDTLGTTLGDVSWSYLLAGRPAEAATAAAEGFRISPSETFIIPNWVNAVLIRGPDEEARTLFERFAGQAVESPKILFECAMQRDLIVLRDVGVASERHLATFRRFLADRVLDCSRPISSQTP